MSSTHVLFYPREAKIPIRPSVYVNSSQYNQLLARDPALVSWVVISAVALHDGNRQLRKPS
ncbi:MAG: hypothetical protein J07HR59_00520 [Halorubrum sp. J07HR59]|nr:MAG: hypothetical protein J07HR59_00520 [Halorubrum sp. J07HR59]